MLYDPFGYTKRFSSLEGYEIPHYYGDHIRLLFFASALISTIAIPLWGHPLPFGTLFEVSGAILLVLFAGLTSPRSTLVLVGDALIAGFAVLFFELTAIDSFSWNAFALFSIREAAAVMMMFALYYSVKTLRAITQHKLGHDNEPQEFL